MSLYGKSIYLGAQTDPLENFIYMVNGSVGANGVDYNDSYVYNSNGDTCLALLKSGTLILGQGGRLDAFLVGGGAGGSGSYLGTDGKPTSIDELNLEAPGGYSANGAGGSGGGAGGAGTITAGDGGSNGNNGGANQSGTIGGNGQGRTTRAFSEETGVLFAGGGGGGRSGYDGYGGLGGDRGGGKGMHQTSVLYGFGEPNTGGGGGAGWLQYVGGGGGYTRTARNVFVQPQSYTIKIGDGGEGGHNDDQPGGNGGSGIILLRSKKRQPTQYYIISYNANTPPGQTAVGIPSDTSKAKDVIYTIPSNYPVCTGGYSFDYWLGSDGVHYDPGDTYSSNAHISFTAIWTNGATCFNFANLNFNDIIFP